MGLVVSGAMGLMAFASAVLIRIRGLAAFGVRRAKPHHFVAAVLGIGTASRRHDSCPRHLVEDAEQDEIAQVGGPFRPQVII